MGGAHNPLAPPSSFKPTPSLSLVARAQRTALTLVCAQKTLTVAAPAVAALAAGGAAGLGGSAAAPAIALLPCVAVHLLQTAFDGVAVARKWL
jgi:hypothetical protein